jgi:hypothetical protein
MASTAFAGSFYTATIAFGVVACPDGKPRPRACPDSADLYLPLLCGPPFWRKHSPCRRSTAVRRNKAWGSHSRGAAQNPWIIGRLTRILHAPAKIRPLKSRTYRKLPSQMAASEWKGERQAFAFVMRGLSVMSRTSFLNRNFHSDGSGLTADVKRANRSERQRPASSEWIMPWAILYGDPA